MAVTKRNNALRSALFLAGVLVAGASGAREFSGNPFVDPSGTVRVDGETVHLFGIYLPPTERTCYEFERPMPCGSRAALALEFHIGVEFLHCQEKQRYNDGSVSALCRVRGEDLSAWLLQKGWALALPEAPFEYHALEKIARSKGVGVWGLSGELKHKERPRR